MMTFEKAWRATGDTTRYLFNASRDKYGLDLQYFYMLGQISILVNCGIITGNKDPWTLGEEAEFNKRLCATYARRLKEIL